LRYKHELVGATLREIGLLLVVFVPLDALIHDGKLNWLQSVICIGLLIVGLYCVHKGIRMEGG